MDEKKKLFLVLAVMIVLFMGLIFWGTAQKKKRLAEIASPEEVFLDEETQDEYVFPENDEISFEADDTSLEPDETFAEESVKDKAASILEKLQQKQEVASQEEPLACRVFRVERVSYEDSLPVTGDIKSLKEIKMRFEKEGVIEKIEVKEGDIVQKGEIIAVMVKQDSLLAVARAQSKFDSDTAKFSAAEKEFEITQALYEKGAILEIKLEEQRLRVEGEKATAKFAEEELKITKSLLEKTELRAPIKGIIGAREAEAGEFFTSRDIVVNLLGVEEVYAEVGIVERDIHKVGIGQKARIQVDAYPNKEFKGKINNLYPVVEGRSRTMKAEITIEDDEGILLPGMFAQVEIFLANLDSALMVPTISLIYAAEDTVLIPLVLLDEGTSEEDIERGEGRGIVKLVEVEVGHSGPDYSQIIYGIKEGDNVVIEAHGDVENQKKVRILGLEKYGVQ
ncbi:MAG: efflux RND transporter periplasmic adaptor subunit [Candidatus Omnitrophota bacterium]